MSTVRKRRPTLEPQAFGIFFVSELVQAVLDGTKSKTRRVLDPQPARRGGAWWWTHPRYDNGGGAKYFHSGTITPSLRQAMVPCAPRAVGDLLYVRETYTYSTGNRVIYLADYRAPGDVIAGLEAGQRKWRPSIHMPRRLARIYLRVTHVDVEQLGEISDDDVLAEGVDSRRAFTELWDRFAGPTSNVSADPWVWVYSFERAEAPAWTKSTR